MFVDRIKIHARAGDGGNGCVSFRREKFVPKGGPDGGDGGRGGDIILETDVHTDNLVDFFYRPLLRAKSGQHGMGKDMYGKAAVDAVFKVPVGTVAYRYLATTNASGNDNAAPEDPPATFPSLPASGRLPLPVALLQLHQRLNLAFAIRCDAMPAQR